MNKSILCILIAVFIVSFGSVRANALGPDDTVLDYFQALQQGDISAIKHSISGDLYKKRKVLLEQNTNYPEFLKNVYQGAEFQIKKSTIQENNAVVTVEVYFPNRQKEFTLFLYKDAAGNWRIFKEISDQ